MFTPRYCRNNGRNYTIFSDYIVTDFAKVKIYKEKTLINDCCRDNWTPPYVNRDVVFKGLRNANKIALIESIDSEISACPETARRRMAVSNCE